MDELDKLGRPYGINAKYIFLLVILAIVIVFVLYGIDCLFGTNIVSSYISFD